MKLIFLYGPPASGKLTIAKELITHIGDNFKIFHNHMTVDIVNQFFNFDSPKSMYLNGMYRRLMFEACAEEGISLITTFVFFADDERDQKYVKEIKEIIEKYGGEVCFVQLQCSDDTLFQRLVNEDRRKYRKLTDKERLRQTMNRWDLKSVIPGVENFVIQTDKLTPTESAIKIIHHFNL